MGVFIEFRSVVDRRPTVMGTNIWRKEKKSSGRTEELSGRRRETHEYKWKYAGQLVLCCLCLLRSSTLSSSLYSFPISTLISKQMQRGMRGTVAASFPYVHLTSFIGMNREGLVTWTIGKWIMCIILLFADVWCSRYITWASSVSVHLSLREICLNHP